MTTIRGSCRSSLLVTLGLACALAGGLGAAEDKGKNTPAERKSAQAPGVAEVNWKLNLPRDPEPGNTFVDAYIERMNGAKNEGADMDTAVATLLTDENLPTALPRLCAALQKPAFTDIYGASSIIQQLIKEDRREVAKVLFPFVVVASSRVTDSGDLQAFAVVCTQLRDKRAMPRLIELMTSADTDVADAATEAAAVIAGVPVQGFDAAQAKTWWARFHATDEVTILRAQLKSKDPGTSIAAAAQLGAIQEQAAIDRLIEWLRSDDPKVAAKAHEQIALFTGRDWAYVATDPKEERLKRVDLLAKWWKENRGSFKLIVNARQARDSQLLQQGGAAAAPADPHAALVRDLASTDGKAAAKAESDLLARGDAAVPWLLDGLENDDPITVRACNRLLQRLAKRTDLSVNPRDPQDKRQQAIAAWRAWAVGKKLVPDPAAAAEPAAEAGAAAPAPAGTPADGAEQAQ